MQILSSNHAVHEIGYHLIWTPKYRHAVLEGAVAVELKHILAETCVAHDWQLHTLEVMPDHVHLFVQADPFVAPVTIVQTLKSISAVYLFQKFPKLKARRFWGSGLWSKGTYYGTVGHISEETIRRYIETQRERS